MGAAWYGARNSMLRHKAGSKAPGQVWGSSTQWCTDHRQQLLKLFKGDKNHSLSQQRWIDRNESRVNKSPKTLRETPGSGWEQPGSAQVWGSTESHPALAGLCHQAETRWEQGALTQVILMPQILI